MSVTAVRGKDWVFNAFWVACGESNAPKCSISIPITSIFRDGKPFKTLGTDELGLVKRIMLEDVPMERNDSERSFRGYSVKTIRALRKLLLEYSLGAGYMQVQEEIGQEPYICNVRIISIIALCRLISLNTLHSCHLLAVFCVPCRLSTWTDRSKSLPCAHLTPC